MKRAAPPDHHLSFQEIWVFDGERFSGPRDVVVSHGRIASIAEPGTGAPGPAERIEGRGRTLLPGFIDSHVHLGLCDARKVLNGGVTTARDLAWPPNSIFPLAERLNANPAAGPRLLAAGAMITAPGGYPSKESWAPAGTGREVATEDEAGRAVIDMQRRGAVVIKIAQEPRRGPVPPPEFIRAIVEEARRLGVGVTSHLGSLDELLVAVETGVDELAHGLWSEERIPDSVIREMAAQKMTVVPTLHIDPSSVRIENLRDFLEAGGNVIYGTDMGNRGPPEGIDCEELRLMMRAGMSLEAALASATSTPAAYLGLGGRGRIVPGAPADLVMVKGDPRKDLGVLGRPELVIRSPVDEALTRPPPP